MAPIAKLSKAVPAEASTTRGTLPFKHLLLGSDQHKLFLKFLGRWRHALGRAYTGLWLGLMSLAVLYADAKISINLRGLDLNYAILWGADPKKADLKGGAA
jgi:hypothetical protein